MSGLKIGPTGEPELTREAKEAIRGYMVYLFTLPAIALTIISAAGGFFINNIAFQSGYNEAYKTAVGDIVTAAKQVELARSHSDEALKTMNKQVEVLDVAVKKATEASNETTQTSEKASKLLTDNIEKLADTLAGTRTFRNAASTVVAPAYADLRGDIEKLQVEVSKIQNLEFIVRTSGRGAAGDRREARCENREVLIGGSCIGFTSNFLGGIGPELENVQNPPNSEMPLRSIICYAANPGANVAAMAICMRPKKQPG